MQSCHLYFLSFKPKNSAKNQQLGEAALRRTNPVFPPIRRCD